MLEETELSRRIGRAWLEISGLHQGFEERVHEADEMFLTAKRAEAVCLLNVRLHILTEGATYDIGTRVAAPPVQENAMAAS